MGGHRQIGIPNLRWNDVIKDMKEKQVNIESEIFIRSFQTQVTSAKTITGRCRRGHLDIEERGDIKLDVPTDGKGRMSWTDVMLERKCSCTRNTKQCYQNSLFSHM